MRALRFGLTLVRHGETRYNKEGLLQGQAIDAPLSEVGLQQAEAAGRYLKDVEFSNVFVSDLLRARQTAETIMKHNSSCSSLQMALDPLLKEISFGVAEGETTAGRGETPEQVKERVKEFMENTLQQLGAEHWHHSTEVETCPSAVEGRADDGVGGVPVHALVVTHGAYMRVVVRYFVEELLCALPQGSDRAHVFSLSPNTGLCRFVLSVRKEENGFQLSGIRCVFVHRSDHVKELVHQ
ncbi:unnamed protein product [Pleuronectes platessa]|uniref:fructose-2,6-bisphosphate 2-phosphatase n=1 Tax=Pleuronectes platessa TaxID=8262 RepID=A0A9N7Y9N3_PLEPL|nr:unnamed protein product [Pleuronectes platessa]